MRSLKYSQPLCPFPLNLFSTSAIRLLTALVLVIILLSTLVAYPQTASALNQISASEATPSGMVWIPKGKFWMGNAEFSDAIPIHQVEINGFWMDKTEVTNAQFTRFVQAKNYVTYAEEAHDGLPAGSFVFSPLAGEEQSNSWWTFVKEADWRHPHGRNSSIENQENHPVVHVNWYDAAAYCQWAGSRLPTEAEWEYASRGGLDRKRYPWGNDLLPTTQWQANIWQGFFPQANKVEDGFRGTSPVASFPANNYGLYDMSGNVWEWIADWYRPDYYSISPQQNPQGASQQDSFDPYEPGVAKRVQRGGSFLCSDHYCSRYRLGSRGKGEPVSAALHVGFRCVKSAIVPN